MNNGFIIRHATLADIDSILEIENRSFDSDKFSRRQFIYLITQAKGTFFILEKDGRAVAYLSLLEHSLRSNLRIYSIAVHPDERGRGLSRLLIDKAIAYARQRHLKFITLEVKTGNHAAIALYEKNGFITQAVKKNYYHDGADAYYMRLNVK